MKKLILTFLIILFTLTSNVVWSADFNKGLEAAQRGDFVTALREWEPLANQGDSNAQYNLGVMYSKGHGVSQDFMTAMKWHTLSAEQGNTDSKRKLYDLNRFFGEDITVINLYENGQLKTKRYFSKLMDSDETYKISWEVNYKDGKKDGKETEWYADIGQIKFDKNYKDGKLDGKWIEWYYDILKRSLQGNYKDGKKDGKWTKWDENGRIKAEIIFKDGECISGDCDFFDNWRESDYK